MSLSLKNFPQPLGYFLAFFFFFKSIANLFSISVCYIIGVIINIEEQLYPHFKEVKNTITDITGFFFFFFFFLFHYCFIYSFYLVGRTIKHSDYFLLRANTIGTATGE